MSSELKQASCFLYAVLDAVDKNTLQLELPKDLIIEKNNAERSDHRKKQQKLN